uniref:Peptidase S1 domain-containing protein n=1 Tax=Glossina brevipalpis TaxID=37001 RepID=A0A1A9WP17_9MUSC
MKFFIAVLLAFVLLEVEVKAFTRRLQPRVVAGRNANQGQFPYIVSLRFMDTHICGGSIISANYILTAAHCLSTEIDDESFDLEPHRLSIYAGSIHLGSGGVAVQVAEYTKHPGYAGLYRDIAVVRLAQPLNFTDEIRPINLSQSDPPSFANADIVGWGRLYENGPRPDILQYNSMASLSHDLCDMLNPLVDESFLCLLPHRREPNGICNGDSGGPAVYNDVLVGVTNFATDACGSAHPDVFANVAYYADWIRENSDLGNVNVENSDSGNVDVENSDSGNVDVENSNSGSVDVENSNADNAMELGRF